MSQAYSQGHLQCELQNLLQFTFSQQTAFNNKTRPTHAKLFCCGPAWLKPQPTCDALFYWPLQPYPSCDKLLHTEHFLLLRFPWKNQRDAFIVKQL